MFDVLRLDKLSFALLCLQEFTSMKGHRADLCIWLRARTVYVVHTFPPPKVAVSTKLPLSPDLAPHNARIESLAGDQGLTPRSSPWSLRNIILSPVSLL